MSEALRRMRRRATSTLTLEALIQARKRDPVQIACPILWDVEDGPVPLFVPSKVTVPEHHIKRLYLKFDRLEEGCFTAKDVRRVFQTNSRVIVFTDRFDRDGDGEVTYEEFKETLIQFVYEEGELSWRERLYLTLSEPGSSRAGFYVSVTVMLFILASTVSFVLESLPALRITHEREECCWDDNSYYNQLYPNQAFPPTTNITSCRCEPETRQIFIQIEAVCIYLFTVEFMLRLLTCMALRFDRDMELKLNVAAVNVHEEQTRRNWFINMIDFLTNIMNLIDLAAILPFYVSRLAGADSTGLGFLRVLRLARVFRVFKMGKYSKNVQLVSKVLMNSAPALQLLLFFVVLGMVLFGSMLYFCEQGEWMITEAYPDGAWLRDDVTGKTKELSPYESIPSCFWWVIVTMTTVGYGDTYPTSQLGKVVGAVAMLCGVLTLALPITIIGANFANEYARAREEEAREQAENEMREIQRQKDSAKSALKYRSEAQRKGRKAGAVHPEGADFVGGQDGESHQDLTGLADDNEMDILMAKFKQSKVKAMQMSTGLIKLLRDFIQGSKMSAEPAEMLIRELDAGQHRMSQGKPLTPGFMSRQVFAVLLWIDRAECESVIQMQRADSNRVRAKFMELFAEMYGDVALGSPDTSSQVSMRKSKQDIDEEDIHQIHRRTVVEQAEAKAEDTTTLTPVESFSGGSVAGADADTDTVVVGAPSGGSPPRNKHSTEKTAFLLDGLMQTSTAQQPSGSGSSTPHAPAEGTFDTPNAPITSPVQFFR